MKDAVSHTTLKTIISGVIGHPAEHVGEVACSPSTEGCSIPRNSLTETGVCGGTAVLDEAIPEHTKGCESVLKGEERDKVTEHRKISRSDVDVAPDKEACPEVVDTELTTIHGMNLGTGTGTI